MLSKGKGVAGSKRLTRSKRKEQRQAEQSKRLVEEHLSAVDESRAAREAKLADVRAQAAKDRARAMAHTHKYLVLKKKRGPHAAARGEGGGGEEDAPLCMTCVENLHKFWMQSNELHELEWGKRKDEEISSQIDGLMEAMKSEVSSQLSDKFIAIAEKQLRNEERLTKPNLREEEDSSQSLSTSSVASYQTAHDRAWRKELKAARELLAAAGLPSSDPFGRSLLPKEPPRVDEVRPNKPVLLMDDSMADDSCGLKIRIWNRDAAFLRSNFLGLVSLNEQVRCLSLLLNASLPSLLYCLPLPSLFFLCTSIPSLLSSFFHPSSHSFFPIFLPSFLLVDNGCVIRTTGRIKSCKRNSHL